MLDHHHRSEGTRGGGRRARGAERASGAAAAAAARRLDQVFRALAHPVRRQILGQIGVAERSISELAAPFDMTLEAVSQHVRVLERARLLRRTRQGRVHRCRMDPAPLRDAGAVLVKLAGFWDRQLGSLERWLASEPEKALRACRLRAHRPPGRWW